MSGERHIAALSARTVRVSAVFHAADDGRAQAVASQMVDRAQQIANLPECECDVDVTVEIVAAPDADAQPQALGVSVPQSPPSV